MKNDGRTTYIVLVTEDFTERGIEIIVLREVRFGLFLGFSVTRVIS